MRPVRSATIHHSTITPMANQIKVSVPVPSTVFRCIDYRRLISAEEISVSKEHPPKNRSEALGLIKKLKCFDFICCIMFMKNIMYKLKSLTEKMEEKEFNVLDAVSIIEGTEKSLIIMMNDNAISDLIEGAKSFSKSLNIDPLEDYARHHRRRLAPKKIDENRENAAEISCEIFYRKEFKCVTDTLISLIGDFLKSSFKILQPFIDCLNILHKSEDFINDDLAEKLVQLMPKKVDSDALKAELDIFCHILKKGPKMKEEGNRSESVTVMDQISEKLRELKNSLPLTNLLFEYILSAPVSVASSERSFSKLNLIANHLRTKIADDRLNSLLLLASEKDLLSSIDYEKVINRWCLLKDRRILV